MIKLLFLHFLADFILQPREMGKKKSSHLGWLAGHLLIQFLVFLPFVGWKLSLINAGIHGLIDNNIWNLYKFSVLKRNKLVIKESFAYWEDHWFYATIGFDQFLHTATLFYLFG